MVLGSGFIIFLDRWDHDSFVIKMTFVDAFYFMIITASTIGYGDIYPITIKAKFSIVILIMIMIFFFTDEISKLVDIFKNTNFYDCYYDFKDHIIIYGTYDP
jgi:hypothetical protein